ncbi:hypothetical protein HOY80DRAFT_896565 [Tuber brumale]|nr:hypothetical protein HOY80DRAFT_896565 [Tuber brumale]
MQALYDELWGKQLHVIMDCTFSIPRPGHGFHPGYKADLREIEDEAFPDPEFAKGKEKKVFKVLKVRSELPCRRKRLLVRQEYETIECNLLEMQAVEWSDFETEIPYLNLDFKIGGQPGSGKSFFLSYLLVRRLLAGQPTAFRRNDNDCYLFNRDSNGSKTDANSLFDLPKDQKKALWILTDGALTNERWNMKGHGWFVVLAASPAKIKASRQWVKDRNVASRYMTNWKWEEIVAAFTLAMGKRPAPRQIAMLFTAFTCLGPIARTCLESISARNSSDYNRTLKGYLGEVDREIDTFFTQGGFQTIENSVHQYASHRMAIMHPTHNRWLYDGRIATRWIAHKVFEKAQAKSQVRCFELYNQLAHQSSLRTAAGWIFEAYAHDWFRKGGSFEAYELPIKDNTPPLKFETYRSESRNYFTNGNNLAAQVRVKGGRGIEQDAVGKYFLPYNANFESVDGLVFGALDTLILLQITIAKSHDIKLGGVKKLCESLPATIKNIHIVFVIPEDRKNEYSRAQSAPAARDVRLKATDLTINQFRLVLTEEIMQTMAVDGCFEVQDGSEDGGESGSGLGDYDGGDTAMGGTQ